MKREEANILSPCSEDWEAMRGDDRRRFCDICEKHVHNLSAMTETEARSVVANKDVCVRYKLDRRTQTIRHRPARRFAVRAVATAAVTASLALPAAAAISKEPGEVGLLAQAWELLTSWGEPDEEVMVGGLMIDEPIPEPPEPATFERIELGSMVIENPPPPVEPELEPLMGDIAEPIEPPVQKMGKVALPAVED